MQFSGVIGGVVISKRSMEHNHRVSVAMSNYLGNRPLNPGTVNEVVPLPPYTSRLSGYFQGDLL